MYKNWFDEKNRLIYLIQDGSLHVFSCRGHLNTKSCDGKFHHSFFACYRMLKLTFVVTDTVPPVGFG